MRSRLDPRLRRLEAQAQDAGIPQGQGLASLLRSLDRDKALDAVPVALLSDAELERQIAALAGARGLSLLVRELLEAERMQRPAAQTKEPRV